MMRRTYFKAAPAALLCLLTASGCGQAQNTAEPQTGTTAPQTTAAASVQTTAPAWKPSLRSFIIPACPTPVFVLCLPA